MSTAAALEAVRGRPTCSVEEAGKVLGISRGLAYKAAHDGSIPTLKLGSRLVVPVHALLRQLELTP